MLGDWLLKLLIVEYVGIALAYAYQGDGWRFLYFVSAAGISVAVVGMR